MEPKYKNLVLSGGSIKGVSHIGAIAKLIDEKLLDLKKLESIAGVSAGALLGLLLVLGFDIKQIWNFIKCLDFKKLINPQFSLFFTQCGIENGKIIYNLFDEILTKKTNTKDITFSQLFQISKIHFTIVGANLTDKETVYYNHINSPTFRVLDAIRISISVPGFFVPVTIGNKKYIDGCVLNNYPMNLFEDKLDETIGILICSEYNTKYTYPEEYFVSIMNLFMYYYYKDSEGEKYMKNTIYINTPKDIFSFNFDINNKIKNRLYRSGLDASCEFIQKLRQSKEIPAKIEPEKLIE